MDRGGLSTGQSYRGRLIAAVVVAAALGIPALILQRYVAETRSAAIYLVIAWFLLVALLLYLVLRPHRHHGVRLFAWGTYAAVIVGVVAVGYWTGFATGWWTRTSSSPRPKPLPRSARSALAPRAAKHRHRPEAPSS